MLHNGSPSSAPGDDSIDQAKYHDEPNPRLEHYKNWVNRKRQKTKRPKVQFKKRFDDTYQKWIVEGLLRQRPLPPSKDGRHIPLIAGGSRKKALKDERRGDSHYISNFIRSNRYTLWSFIPKQLWFQFAQKMANLYFLCISVLQLIPGLSTIGSYTTIAPLLVFVAIAMAKEGYDDWVRYDMDKAENRSPVWVLDPARIARQRSNLASGLADRAREKTKKETKRVAGRLANYATEAGSTEMENIQTKQKKIKEHEGDWSVIQWQNLRVGDIVRLKRDDFIPADMVLLHATGPNGVAFIETMALDGETNLKSKQAPGLLAGRCSTVEEIQRCSATIVSEDPNSDLYNYDGRVIVADETMPIMMDNVIYRGSTLRNTSEAFGMVINTGEECKIRMNANKHVHAKSPRIQGLLDKLVIFLVLVLLIITGGCTGGYYLWRSYWEPISFYLIEVSFPQIFFGFIIMFNTLIPLSLYISLEIIKVGQFFFLGDVEMYDEETNTPLGVNTTTILENLGQVSYVFSDKTGTLTENKMRFRKLSVAGTAWLHDEDMRREEAEALRRINSGESKGKGSQQNGNRPSQDHGQSLVKPEPNTRLLLDYIRDKPNSPVARRAKHFLLAIALCHTCLPEIHDDGDITFQASSPDELALVQAAQDLGFLLIDRPSGQVKLQILQPDGSTTTEVYQVLDVIEFSSQRKRMSIVVRKPDGRICIYTKGADNVIMPRLKQRKLAQQKADEVERLANEKRSTEATRVRALQRASFQMRPGSSGKAATPRTSINPLRRQFSGRQSSDFGRLSMSNARRSQDLARFGEVLEDNEDLHTPFALHSPRQSMVLNSPFSAPLTDDNYFPQLCNPLVDETLASSDAAVFERCFRHLDDFASEGLRTLLFAHRYISDDDYKRWHATYHEATTSLVDRQQMIEDAAELIEKDFDLTGATAIEDRLQAGVPDTIDKLRRANIKVWMLTGDKRETAVNIANSARICKPFSEIHVLDAKAEGPDLQQKITSTLMDISRGMTAHSVLVVDGQTLSTISDDETLKIMFYDLVVRIDAVVCCRASPSQKADLVQCIRDTVPDSLTLAIGDGANDIAMIQAAHVGVGISGREGLQAARVADYSIAQFRFLQRLLFVHGRWMYMRTGKYFLATFWKEIVFYMVQAQYQRYTGYSGTSLYESWSLTVFNILFTSLPVILLGMFEIDLKAETLLAVPELYTFGQRDESFNLRKYLSWMVLGVVETVTIWWIVWGRYDKALYSEDNGIFPMGTLAYLIVIWLINIKILFLELHNKILITTIGAAISVVVWFPFIAIVTSPLYPQDERLWFTLKGLTETWGPHFSWWVTVAGGIGAVAMLEVAVSALRRNYFPNDTDIWQEIEAQGRVDEVLKEYTPGGEQEQQTHQQQRQENGAGHHDDGYAPSRDGQAVSNVSPV